MGNEQDLRCHYVQQARLKQFAVQEGEHYKLTTVDLKRKKIGRRNVERAFYIKGLYPNDVERELNSKIEAPGMKVFDKVYKSRGAVMLTREELETMKKYLLVQLYRNPINISHYSPDWEGDVLGVNKSFKNDAEANLHVAEKIHTICNSTWKELRNTDDYEIHQNVSNISGVMTLFVRSPTLEFVINDMGSVTERIEHHIRDRNIVKQVLSTIPGINLTEEIVDEWMGRHQFFDNFTFFPISSHFGIVTIDQVWTTLIRERQPFEYTKSIVPDRLFDVTVDSTFFDWVYKETGIHSDFIKELFVPCIPLYESEKINNAEPEKKWEMIEKYSTPNDRYFYPVVDLDLQWAEYLNRLTINEAREYFAFGSIADGKISISNYNLESLLYPGAKNNLDWIDWDSDWTKPLN